METPWTFWCGLNLAVVVRLVLDLSVLGRRPRGPSIRESIVTTLVWVALALCFGGWIVGRDGIDIVGDSRHGPARLRGNDAGRLAARKSREFFAEKLQVIGRRDVAVDEDIGVGRLVEHLVEIADFLVETLAPCRLYAAHDPNWVFHIHYIAVPDERASDVRASLTMSGLSCPSD